MSVIGYDISRTRLPHTLSFPNFYNPLTLSHSSRPNPRGYPIRGLVGGLHGRINMGCEDPPMDTASARRRIAVACARCRKRKIRCSGDQGDGYGCDHCRTAGIDPMHCQFHRVGSDNVHKIMDNFNMVQSLASMSTTNTMSPTCSASGLYHRAASAQQYPQLDTKSLYPTTWTVPYEVTSSDETYHIEQSPMYLPGSTPLASTTLCDSTAYRWSHPISRNSLIEPATYIDQNSAYSANGLPLSPLSNMSSLQMNLPERPQGGQLRGPDPVAPQRLLPFPQPTPIQSSRNAVDQLQDQRLRSAQAIGASNMDSKTPIFKSTAPWCTAADDLVSSSTSMTTGINDLALTSNAFPNTTDEALNYTPTTTSISVNGSAASAPQMHLNFSTSTLLDVMSVTTPKATYSNFRKSCRAPTSSSTTMERQASHNTMYSFDSESTAKRSSLTSESSSDYALMNGHTYSPLNHPESQNSPGKNTKHRDSSMARHVPPHRASISNLSNSYST